MNEQQLAAIKNYSDRPKEGVTWKEVEYESPDPYNSLFALVAIESPFHTEWDLPRWRCRIEFGSGGERYTMNLWDTKVRAAATALAYESLKGVGTDDSGTLIDDVRGAMAMDLYKWMASDELDLIDSKFKTEYPDFFPSRLDLFRPSIA